MSKKINFTYKNKDYTLEFTRQSIRTLEEKGFVLADAESKPMTVLPQLFAGAFIAHHRLIAQDTIDDIYDHMPDKAGLIKKLAEMYAEPINALMAEPEDAEGNVSWTPSF